MCRSVLSQYVLVLSLVFSFAATAQENMSDADAEATMAGVRETVQAARKQIIEEEMFLTDEEAVTFWPIYDEYRREINAVGDRYARLILDFAKLYNEGRVTGEDANRMVDESLEIEAEFQKIEAKYVHRLRDVLPSLKAARFYQLENKMNAEAEAQLALTVPLIDLQ